LKYMT